MPIDPVTGSIITSLIGGLFGLGRGGGGDTPTTSEEQRQLQQQMLQMIQQQQGYMSQLDPLRESVLRMAMGMLPTRYQTGMGFRTGGGTSGGGGGQLGGNPWQRNTRETAGQSVVDPADEFGPKYREAVETFRGRHYPREF